VVLAAKLLSDSPAASRVGWFTMDFWDDAALAATVTEPKKFLAS
jgi:hypothetical protein